MPVPSSQPRYLQLAQTLISEIETGHYPVGGLLPTEYELCEQFGASRFTVREAVKQLVQRGLVTRQAGIGTRVLTARAQTAYRQVMAGMADLQQYSAETELEILDMEMAEVTGNLAVQLGASAGQHWLRVQGLRRIEGSDAPPICVTDIYIHPVFRTVRHLGGRSTVPVYVRIEEQFGETVVEVQQQISAHPLGHEASRLLSAEEGAPALSVCRTYLNRRAEIIEVAMSTHPADRFSYSETFRREWQATTASET